MSTKPKCPHCQSEDITITIQYQKSILFRLLKFACIIALIFTLLNNMAEIIQYNYFHNNLEAQNITLMTEAISDSSPQPFGVAELNPTGLLATVFIIAWCFFEILQQYIESKPRIYYVCKECRKIWHYDEDI